MQAKEDTSFLVQDPIVCNKIATDLYSTWKTASKLIPKVNVFHWRDCDHMWSVEACMARPVRGGFRRVTDFIDNPTMPSSNILNPKAYARAMITEKKISKTTPLKVIDELHRNATEAIAKVNDIRKSEKLQVEGKVLLDDIEAMAYLGHYYAEKIDAAVSLAYYQELKGKSIKRKLLHI